MSNIKIQSLITVCILSIYSLPVMALQSGGSVTNASNPDDMPATLHRIRVSRTTHRTRKSSHSRVKVKSTAPEVEAWNPGREIYGPPLQSPVAEGVNTLAPVSVSPDKNATRPSAVNQPVSPPTATAAVQKPADKPEFLSSSRPDPLATAGKPEGGAAAPGKLLLYLIPVILGTVLAIHILKRFQDRSGGMQMKRKGVFAALKLAADRNTTPSSIRLLESMPVGPVVLHLVEVRDRTLVIASSGTQVTMLTEFKADDPNPDFAAIFGSAREAYKTSHETEVESVVFSIDDTLRAAREAMEQGAARSKPFNRRGMGESRVA